MPNGRLSCAVGDRVESLAAGQRSWPWRRRGFTLLEILLALALIGLLASVLIGGSARLLADRPATVEDVFWRVVDASRRDALHHRVEVRLRYDPAARAFVAAMAGGEQHFPVPETGELKIDFLSVGGQGSGPLLIGGLLMETATLPSVTFYDDGTCSPFRLQIATGGPARVLEIDPWTCAPALTPKAAR